VHILVIAQNKKNLQPAWIFKKPECHPRCAFKCVCFSHKTANSFYGTEWSKKSRRSVISKQLKI